MIEFAWINYIKVVSALLVLYYASIFFFIKKKEKSLNGPERSKSNSKDDEYINSSDNESHVEQIQLDEFLLSTTEERSIPEGDSEAPSVADENPYISDDIPDIPDMPDIPDLPEVSEFNELDPSIEEDEDQTISADSNFEIEDEYESVDISIQAISGEDDHFIDGTEVEDFKNEFLNDDQPFKKDIISFDELMQQNPSIHKTLIEN